MGVSAQQIRNYLDAGVLPPAPRTPTGHRVLGTAHRDALLTYRALAGGHGWRSAGSIMTAVHAGAVADALALVDAGHAAQHNERLSLAAAGKALEAVARQQPDTAPPAKGMSRIGEVATLLGVRTSALRVWESAGLLTPERESGTGYRFFRPTDVRDARLVSLLRRSHYRFTEIRPVLAGLREAGSTQALRTALARREEELTRRTRAMLEGSARLHDYLAARPKEFTESGEELP